MLKSAMEKFRTSKVNMLTTETQCLNAVDDGNESLLWLKRYGHLSFISLGHLKSKQLVQGTPKGIVLEKTCEVCMRRKQLDYLFSLIYLHEQYMH